MDRNSKLASVLIMIVGLIALAMATAASAQPQNSGQRGERERGRPIFGEILSIDENTITIAPKIPEFLAERLAKRGEELPDDLPSEVELNVSADTKWFVDSKKSDSSGFSVGDMVAVVVRPNNVGPPTALKVSDEATAKQFVKQQMQQRGQQGGQQRGGQQGDQSAKQRGGQQRGQHGPGNRDGRGGQGGKGNNQQRQRPAFGEIIYIDETSVTIRPEIPAFLQAKMDERGGGKEIELPDELSFALNDKTHYIVDGEPADTNPFGVGDKVAVMGGGGRVGTAMAVADYATVEAKMQERGDKDQRGGKGQGKGKQQGKQRKQGKQGKGGGNQGKDPRGQR